MSNNWKKKLNIPEKLLLLKETIKKMNAEQVLELFDKADPLGQEIIYQVVDWLVKEKEAVI